MGKGWGQQLQIGRAQQNARRHRDAMTAGIKDECIPLVPCLRLLVKPMKKNVGDDLNPTASCLADGDRSFAPVQPIFRFPSDPFAYTKRILRSCGGQAVIPGGCLSVCQ